MTKEEFTNLWEKGSPVGFGDVAVKSNFSSFPEEVTAYHHSGEFWGVHLAFDEIETFDLRHEVCAFDIEAFSEVPIENRKASHGEYVYLVKMLGHDYFPVKEIEYGREYRSPGCCCILRRVKI